MSQKSGSLLNHIVPSCSNVVSTIPKFFQSFLNCSTYLWIWTTGCWIILIFTGWLNLILHCFASELLLSLIIGWIWICSKCIFCYWIIVLFSKPVHLLLDQRSLYCIVSLCLVLVLASFWTHSGAFSLVDRSPCQVLSPGYTRKHVARDIITCDMSPRCLSV